MFNRVCFLCMCAVLTIIIIYYDVYDIDPSWKFMNKKNKHACSSSLGNLGRDLIDSNYYAKVNMIMRSFKNQKSRSLAITMNLATNHVSS